MEIGNQIRQLRQRRGITQEAMAQHFGVTPQAVSKWERGAATPDIAMLPELSAYFGVTIDELFALSDETRLDRIQNMIWDVRYFDPALVEKEREFLLEKGRRKPENDKVYELLAEIENHLAAEHREKAAQYAKEAIARNPANEAAHWDFIVAMGGVNTDWYTSANHALIEYYQDFVKKHPEIMRANIWLIEHLLDAGRLEEAKVYVDRFCNTDDAFRALYYHGEICRREGDREKSAEYWRTMLTQYPDNHKVWFNMAQIQVKQGDYEQAKFSFRKAMELQPGPKYVDYLESIARIWELQGDIPKAIETLQEELVLLKREFLLTEGETVDQVKRNIARLKQKL